MSNTPKDYSFPRGLRVAGAGVVVMMKKRPIIFVWVNFFATWFVGGAAYMLYSGSDSVLPIVCVLTPLVALSWVVLVASKYGFSRLLGLPRVAPWLVATAIAINEVVSQTYVTQPAHYYEWLIGFLVINGIASVLDFIDIARWLNGERAEQFDTGFFA